MKRDVLFLTGCIVLSLILYFVALYVSLEFSVWGQFNSEPISSRPSLSAALASKHKLGLLFHIGILPLTAVAVGVVAGIGANKPWLVAILGILPLQLFYLRLEGFGALSLLSAITDFGIAPAAAYAVRSRS